MYFSVIDAERFYLDGDMSRLRFRLRNLLHDEAVEAAEFFEDNCTHQIPPWIGMLGGGCLRILT